MSDELDHLIYVLASVKHTGDHLPALTTDTKVPEKKHFSLLDYMLRF